MTYVGLWENVILIKIILTTDGIIGYAKRGTWYHDVRHQLMMLQDPINTKCWWCKQCILAGCTADVLYCGPCAVGLVNLRGRVFEVEVKGIEQDLIPYVGHLACASVPVEGWIIDFYGHGLLVPAMVCDSLPTMEKMSNLLWWPEVLAWSQIGAGALNYSLSFPQRSLQTPLNTPQHTPAYCTCTCILLHFSV